MSVHTNPARRKKPVWTFADKIRKVRSLTGMDQREFAAALNVTSSALAQWETGRAIPRDIVAIAKRIELMADVSAAWMLGVDDGPDDDGPDDDGGSRLPESNRRPIHYKVSRCGRNRKLSAVAA